jgi:hypothetical protein
MVLRRWSVRHGIPTLERGNDQRGYVDEPEHWRYSSARNYAGRKGLVDVDAWY